VTALPVPEAFHARFPQYRVLPVEDGGDRVYVLCRGGHCIRATVKPNGDVIVDDPSGATPQVIDYLLYEKGALTPHEAEALAAFFGVDRDAVVEYAEWAALARRLRGRTVVVVRGHTYIVDSGVEYVGSVGDPREYGARVASDPAHALATAIRREHAPDYAIPARGGVLLCSLTRRTCTCFKPSDAFKVVNRILRLPLERPENWHRAGRGYRILVGGEWYDADCPPTRRP